MKKEVVERIKKDSAFFIMSIMAGIMIAIGGMAYLYITSYDSSSIWLKMAGGFAFTIGLIFIVLLDFKLFTGLNCDLLDTNYKDWYKLIISFLGNSVGCWFGSLLIFKTSVGSKIMIRAIEVAGDKLSTNLGIVLLSAILCGVFITMAVLGNRACKQSKMAGIFAIILPIFTFVVLGVEHSVANQVYFALATLGGKPFTGEIILHTLIVMIGNILGGILIPVAIWGKKKLTEKKEIDSNQENSAEDNE
ncbi:MAG: formate/nitrite transporter family protein [Clostridia bacterium]|nr:formate/nitrite transporter family protein [Clostridia bacterium]